MKKTKSYYTKLSKTIVTKMITFLGKSYEQIQAAYMALKNRYKRTVKMGKLIPMGAGLYRGMFEVA